MKKITGISLVLLFAAAAAFGVCSNNMVTAKDDAIGGKTAMIPENMPEQPGNDSAGAPGGLKAVPAPGEIYYPGYDMPGARHDYTLDGYSEEIKSGDIEMFSYVGTDFTLFYGPKEDGFTYVICKGGSYSARDGSAFSVCLTVDSDSPEEAGRSKALLSSLQQIIAENSVSNGNGHIVEVNGLPGGIGDLISVRYKSGEEIYKKSNQFRTVPEVVAQMFYSAFHDYVVLRSFDFTTEGSNVKIYDDADEEFLQGTWNGDHFGHKISVVFEGNHVKIYKDEVLTDDCDYVIINGAVKTAALKELEPGKERRGDEFDYEEFSEISGMRKHNYFTIDAYFAKDSYSSCTLHNFDKEDPEKEKKAETVNVSAAPVTPAAPAAEKPGCLEKLMNFIKGL